MIYIYVEMWIILGVKLDFLLNTIPMTILWKKLKIKWSINGKTFVGNTRIFKKIPYLKPSCDLWIYIYNIFKILVIHLIYIF